MSTNEDSGKARSASTVFSRESDKMNSKVQELVGLMDMLTKRLEPVLLPTPQGDAVGNTSEAMSPLCSSIRHWHDRADETCMGISRILEEMQL